MTINFMQRGLTSEGGMAVAAGNYQRSTAGIVLEVIVGLLTAGIGVIGFEAYHSFNKSHKNREFAELAGELLQGMQNMPHEESGFEIPYQGSMIRITPSGSDVKIEFGGEEKIIPGKTIGEIRENLKREIVSNIGTYGAETAKKAILDETRNQRSLAIQFLQARTNVSKFDHLDTENLVEASIDLIDNRRTSSDIESEFSPSDETSKKVIDAECRELINEWEKKPPVEKGKVNYVQAVADPALAGNRPVQSEDEKKVRKLMAEIFFPEKSWEADTKQAGERLKQVLIANSELLAQLYSNPELINAAGLPEDLTQVVQDTMQDLKTRSSIPEGVIQAGTVATALEMLPAEAYSELSESIDQKLGEFQFSSLDSVKMLATLGGIGEGNFQTFLKNIFSNYFDNQSVIDKRAMLASYLTNSGSEDSNEMKLVALLKGGGPYLQKLLQLFGDKAEGELKAALDELKTGLSPINEDIIKAVLAGIIDKSGGTIRQIDVVGSLGAASVGQTVLANIHWKNKEEPQEVVVKILRPGIRLRAERELKFFEDEARKIPGMLKTFNGISEQIQVEMDLTKEARNVQRAQVYNHGAQNMQAMKLVDKIAPSQGYMVLDKAPGTTLKAAFHGLRSEVAKPMNAENTAPDVGAKMASGIKSLTKRWVEEALFGSGFYHGDLHAGNIMFSSDATASGLTTVIDMGNAALLSLDQRRAVFKMVLAAGLRNAEVFVRNYEQVLSEEGRGLIVAKRAELMGKTQEIMAQTEDPGEIIVAVLSAANQLGLEIPATVSNFSRSQMMLQNAIDNINDLNGKTREKLDESIESLVQIQLIGENFNSLDEALVLAKQKLATLSERPDDQLNQLELHNKEQLERLVKYIDIRKSGSLQNISFSDLIMEVVKNHKMDSVGLAYGDIWKFISA